MANPLIPLYESPTTPPKSSMPDQRAVLTRTVSRLAFLHNTTRRSSGMLADGARGATQVRGKDSVHPEWFVKAVT